MRVVVDTFLWSLALRRNAISQAMLVVNQLRDLIVDGRVVLLGAVAIAQSTVPKAIAWVIWVFLLSQTCLLVMMDRTRLYQLVYWQRWMQTKVF